MWASILPHWKTKKFLWTPRAKLPFIWSSSVHRGIFTLQALLCSYLCEWMDAMQIYIMCILLHFLLAHEWGSGSSLSAYFFFYKSIQNFLTDYHSCIYNGLWFTALLFKNSFHFKTDHYWHKLYFQCKYPSI